MKQDEMIEMAKQAQMPFYWRTGEITYLDKLEAFAKLVAQHEREACAKVIEQCNWPKWAETTDARDVFAEAIRARG
jgi:hypothetical protein